MLQIVMMWIINIVYIDDVDYTFAEFIKIKIYIIVNSSLHAM